MHSYPLAFSFGMNNSNVVSLHVNSCWSKKTTKTDTETVTLPLLNRDVGTDVMEKNYAVCQTERIDNANLSSRNVLISENVIQTILAAIEQARDEHRLFVALDELRSDEKITIMLKRTIHIEKVSVKVDYKKDGF